MLRAYWSHLMLLFTVKLRSTPHRLGSKAFKSSLMLGKWVEAFLRHSHALCRSFLVGTEDFKSLTPLQQAVEGWSSPPMRNPIQGSIVVLASSKSKACPTTIMRNNIVSKVKSTTEVFILYLL